MKKFLFLLFFIAANNTFAQTYNLEQNGIIKMDSILKNIVLTNYQNKFIYDKNNIDYYNNRIKDVMIKYYYVIEDENDLKIALEENWFLNSFKPALDNALYMREIYLNKK